MAINCYTCHDDVPVSMCAKFCGGEFVAVWIRARSRFVLTLNSERKVVGEMGPCSGTVVGSYCGHDVDGLVQDCSISTASALEILQSCTKSLMCSNGSASSLWECACGSRTSHQREYKYRPQFRLQGRFIPGMTCFIPACRDYNLMHWLWKMLW